MHTLHTQGTVKVGGVCWVWYISHSSLSFTFSHTTHTLSLTHLLTTEYAYAWKTLLQAGITCAGGSDGKCGELWGDFFVCFVCVCDIKGFTWVTKTIMGTDILNRYFEQRAIYINIVYITVYLLYI